MRAGLPKKVWTCRVFSRIAIIVGDFSHAYYAHVRSWYETYMIPVL
jgi:hypothetical protein